MNPGSLPDLIAALRNRSDTAATRVVNEYAQRLIGLARTRLSTRLQQKTDPEDVVQSVFRTFFRRQADGHFSLEDSDDLWNLLARITVCKCARVAEFYSAASRDVAREVPGQQGSFDEERGFNLTDHKPSRVEVEMLTQTLEEIMRGLSIRDRTIVEMRLAEYSVPEIVSAVGCSDSTVDRVVRRVRERLRRALVADD